MDSNPEAAVPLFLQVYAALRREILDGTFVAGTALPSEPQLCRRFHVSRITLRRAVDELVNEDLVVRRQGSGTFVAGVRLKIDMLELRGFEEELRAQGHEPTVETLERRIIPAPSGLARPLGLAVGDPVVHFRRRFSSPSEHLALSHGYYPYRTCSALMDADLEVSTYQFIEDVLGLDIAYAEQTLEPRLARAEEADLLGVPRRSLLLLITRVTFLESGEPVHFGRILQRADRYKATTILRRRRRRGAPAMRPVVPV